MEIINKQIFNFPAQGCTDDGPSLMAVLTEDDHGLFAVYVGYGSPNWIAANGAKETYKRALYYFPMLKKEHYRR